MQDNDQAAVKRQPEASYETPELLVHGSVADLTRGGTGNTQEIGAQGSYFADGGG